MARLRDAGRHLGRGEIFVVAFDSATLGALAVAVSRRASGLCLHCTAGVECGSCGVCADEAAQRDRLQHWVGATLGIVRAWEFSGFWRDRYSARNGDSFHPVRAEMGGMEIASVCRDGDFVLHGVAGRISISRIAAEHLVEVDEE